MRALKLKFNRTNLRAQQQQTQPAKREKQVVADAHFSKEEKSAEIHFPEERVQPSEESGGRGSRDYGRRARQRPLEHDQAGDGEGHARQGKEKRHDSEVSQAGEDQFRQRTRTETRTNIASSNSNLNNNEKMELRPKKNQQSSVPRRITRDSAPREDIHLPDTNTPAATLARDST